VVTGSASAFVFLTLTVSAQTYFPPGVLAGKPEAGQVAAIQYSKFLRSLHEPSLWELAQQDSKVEAYRLLWLREVDRPASIRFLVKPGGTGWFYRRMTTGKGGTQPGRIRNVVVLENQDSVIPGHYRGRGFLESADARGRRWDWMRKATCDSRICPISSQTGRVRPIQAARRGMMTEAASLILSQAQLFAKPRI
jgi:hypothetical protein